MSYDPYSRTQAYDYNQYPPQAHAGGGGHQYDYGAQDPYGGQAAYPPYPAGNDYYGGGGYGDHGGGGGGHFQDYSGATAMGGGDQPHIRRRSTDKTLGGSGEVGYGYGSSTEKFHDPPAPAYAMADENNNNRGSVAAMMAANGEIPKKEGLRLYRHDENQGQFTKGGRGRTCGRCCCCTAIVVILIIIGVVAGFLLWVRPPNVQFQGVEAPANGSEFESQSGGFLIHLNLKVQVDNPNFFGANLAKVSAKAFFPSNHSQQIGGGSLNDVHISKKDTTVIHFPFTVNYTVAQDPGFKELTYIATQCGFIGGNKQPIDVDYDITIKVKVIAFSISPTFSGSTNFDCPLQQSDLAGLLGSGGGGGGDLGALGGLLGNLGGGGNRRAAIPEYPASPFGSFEEREVEEEPIRKIVRRI